mmetsp:Transcript_1251/g.3584  ORF Transcript_1251/g.3584 Transcript_1251/m.3584 type:complete len:264 (-) Transcript_1251:693-1484(-)
MVSLPLMASSPMLSRPTLGSSMPSTADTSALPITANCSRFSAAESTLAPRSSTVVKRPAAFGITAAIAGRSIPSSVLSKTLATAISAPVLPADTQAWASAGSPSRPGRSCWIATRIDESRLRRRATSIGSSIVTTSLAATTRQRGKAAAAVNASGLPTSTNSALGCLSRKARQAGSVTDGPWSPPMQSTARRTGSGSAGRGAWVIETSVRTDAVQKRPNPALRGTQAGLADSSVCTAPARRSKLRPRRPCSSAPCGHGRNRWG